MRYKLKGKLSNGAEPARGRGKAGGHLDGAVSRPLSLDVHNRKKDKWVRSGRLALTSYDVYLKKETGEEKEGRENGKQTNATR